MDQELTMMMERVNRHTEELARIKRALIAMSQGKTFTEAFDEELYLEGTKRDAKPANKFMKQIIIHIFKLKYGNDTLTRRKLSEEIKLFREEIDNITDRDTEDPDVNVLCLVEKNISLAYRRAFNEFERILDADPKSYHVSSMNSMPKECPWTFDEIMDMEIDVLLRHLPYL